MYAESLFYVLKNVRLLTSNSRILNLILELRINALIGAF